MGDDGGGVKAEPLGYPTVRLRALYASRTNDDPGWDEFELQFKKDDLIEIELNTDLVDIDWDTEDDVPITDNSWAIGIDAMSNKGMIPLNYFIPDECRWRTISTQPDKFDEHDKTRAMKVQYNYGDELAVYKFDSDRFAHAINVSRESPYFASRGYFSVYDALPENTLWDVISDGGFLLFLKTLEDDSDEMVSTEVKAGDVLAVSSFDENTNTVEAVNTRTNQVGTLDAHLAEPRVPFPELHDQVNRVLTFADLAWKPLGDGSARGHATIPSNVTHMAIANAPITDDGAVRNCKEKDSRTGKYLKPSDHIINNNGTDDCYVARDGEVPMSFNDLSWKPVGNGSAYGHAQIPYNQKITQFEGSVAADGSTRNCGDADMISLEPFKAGDHIVNRNGTSECFTAKNAWRMQMEGLPDPSTRQEWGAGWK